MAGDAGADLALLTEAAEAAAELALHWQDRAPKVWHKDNDAGPVTEADMAVDTMLRESLRAARPSYGWLSEETPDSDARLAHEAIFIVDPIDGTRAFIEGRQDWGHSLAIATAGRITAAVVLMPRLGKRYAAAAGQGAWLNGAPLAAAGRAQAEGGTILTRRSALEARHWPGGAPGMVPVGRSPMAYRLACLAEGGFDALFAPGPIWDWDLAAGALLLTESGHRLTTAEGGDWAFNAPHPRAPGALAANPALHAELLARRSG